MNTLLILSFSFAFLLVALTRPRLAFYLFVFLLPFLPRYIAISIGQEGFALSQRRIFAIIMFIGFAASLVMLPEAKKRIMSIIANRHVRRVALTVLLIYIIKMLSTVVNSGIVNVFYVLDEILNAAVVMFMVIVFVRSQTEERIILILVVAGLLVSEVASLAEKMKDAPLLQDIYSVEVAVHGRDPLVGRTRAEIYRCQAFFDNPLLLSQFMCIALPVAWFLRYDESRKVRFLANVSLLLAPLTLLFTQTRSGYLVATLSLAFYAFSRLYRRSRMMSRGMVIVFSAVLVFVVGLGIIDVFAHPTEYFSREQSAGRSALARILQYQIVYEAMIKSPLIGWGMTRNYIVDLDLLNNLDSYWLRILLEGGISLGMMYVLLFLGIRSAAVKHVKRAQDEREVRLAVTINTLMVAMLLYMFFLSIPTNNTYLFLFIGILMRRIGVDHYGNSLENNVMVMNEYPAGA